MEAIDILIILGLILLGTGFFYRGRAKHRFRAVGWILIAAYWPTRAPHFLAIDDYVNTFFCFAALPFFLYLAFQEEISFGRNEDHRGLEFIAGASFIAGFPYFLIEGIPELSGALIYEVAKQSVWLFNRMSGESFFALPPQYSDGELGSLVPDAKIRIVLACTAIQSILIGAGVVLANHGKTRQKIKALIMNASVIYFLNIFRNAGVIYLTYYNITDFETAHNTIAKTGSLIALIILLFITFEIIPELYDDLLDLIKLSKRTIRLKK